MGDMEKKKDDRAGLIIGGCTLLGLAVGFILLQYNAMYFLGSLMAGIGIGLIISSFVVKK